MRILFDYQVFSFQKHGGISRYFVELIKRVPTGSIYNIAGVFSDNVYLSESKRVHSLERLLPKYSIRVKIYKYINTMFSYYNVLKGGFDVFHPTYYDNYYLSVIKKPFVITIHDLIPELYQKDFFKKDTQLLLNRKNAIDKCNRIIAISENTKKDLIRYYNVNPEKIDVIYHGPNTFKKDTIINRWGQYLLYVGSRDAYKNFLFFIESVSIILKYNADVKIICVGSEFTLDESKLFDKLGILERIQFIQADNITLYQLYSNAICFVYPSLYEGFGMPILEAFDCGCPVVLSNSSSLPEIAQGGAIYFDAEDSLSLIGSIERIINDFEFRSNLILKGYERLKFFSWTKCAEETQKTYTKCII
jgi:glycosyltransferase involved in cell wall biosynthesis